MLRSVLPRVLGNASKFCTGQSFALRALSGVDKVVKEKKEKVVKEKVIKEKRVLSDAMMKPHKLSPALSLILGGKTEATRQEALKGVWDYIKEHGLQDPNNKRTILGDPKLTSVFGQSTATIPQVKCPLSSQTTLTLPSLTSPCPVHASTRS